jgi:hypothetical protein
MRTPVRLAATLLKSRMTKFSGNPRVSRIAIKSSEENDGAISSDFSAALVEAQRSTAPILWLTGDSDPLEFPAIGKISRQLQERGRTVFVETDGQQLRRRIHEFRPDARLYLTVRLHGTSHAHDICTKTAGAFARALEGVRAAQLSGFLVCAHVVLDAAAELDEIKQLLQQLHAMQMDGVIVTAGNDSARTAKKVMAARELLGNSWWAKFSKAVQLTLEPRPQPPAAARYSQDPNIASEEVAAQ